MKKYLSLVRIMFVQQYKKSFATADTKKKRIRTTVAYWVLLAVCFLPICLSIAVAMFYIGKYSEGNVYIATFLTLICQGLVLMFGTHSIMSNVYVTKDADKLLYLPVRAHVIFIAKLTVAYINEVITTAISILVVLLPFGIGSHVGFAYYVSLLFSLVLIPMLPMLIGSLLSMPLSALVVFFGKRSTVKTIIRIVFYAGMMALYMYAMYQFGFISGSENGSIFYNPEVYIRDMIEHLTERARSIMPYFHPDYMLANGMLARSFGTWIAGIFASVGENALLLGLVYLTAMPFYRRMLSAGLEEGGSRPVRNGKETLKVSNRGVVREFVFTDLKRTVRDQQLGFQSFAGLIMLPLIVVIFYFVLGISDEGDASFLELMAVSDLYQVIAPLVILAYMAFLGSGTNVLGIFPISRENRSVYILKSLPVPFGKILLAKVLLSTAVMLVSDFVSCVLIVALMGVKWYYGLVMLVTMALIGFGVMCITTLLDLRDPHFGWQNFSQGLKNVKNSYIAMLIALLTVLAVALLAVPFVVLYALFGGWYWILAMWIVIVALSVAFATVTYKIMDRKATKYFERIEV